MIVLLEGTALKSKQALHETMACALHFPPWYGGNLDALFDCLTDLHQKTTLHLRHPEALEQSLGAYAHRFLQVLRRVEEENTHFQLILSSIVNQ